MVMVFVMKSTMEATHNLAAENLRSCEHFRSNYGVNYFAVSMAACRLLNTSSRLLAATARLPRMFYSKTLNLRTYVRMFNM